MTKERLILLIILEITAFALIFQLSYGSLSQSRERLEEKRLLNERLISSMENNPGEHDRVSEETKNHVLSLYRSFEKEPDIYHFGQEIKTALLREKLSISRFQEIETAEHRYLECHVEGYPARFFSFLEAMENQKDIFIEISSLTINAQYNPARITFRISPAPLPEGIVPPVDLDVVVSPKEKKNYSHTPAQLGRLFYREAVVAEEKPEVIPESIQKPMVNNYSIDYIGKVKTKEAGDNLCFKDTRTGQIIVLSPKGDENPQGWRLIENNDTRFVLTLNEEKYEVNK